MAKKLVAVTVTLLVDVSDDAETVAQSVENGFDSSIFGWDTVDAEATGEYKSIEEYTKANK